jgi:hypothetical protein
MNSSIQSSSVAITSAPNAATTLVMNSPIQSSSVAITSAPNAATTAVPSVMPTAITTGVDLTASSIPPENNPLPLPVHQFVSPFDVSLHFDNDDAFPTSLGGLSNEAATSNLAPGVFDPYPYPTSQPAQPAYNHALSADPSTATQGSAAETNPLKRSRPQDLSEEIRSAKRQKSDMFASSATGQQGPVYQTFQVGRSELERSVINPVGYGMAAGTNHGQSHVVSPSSMSFPVVNEEPTTNIDLSFLFNMYPRLPGMTDNEYQEYLQAKLASQLPSTGV